MAHTTTENPVRILQELPAKTTSLSCKQQRKAMESSRLPAAVADVRSDVTQSCHESSEKKKSYQESSEIKSFKNMLQE